MFPKREIFPFTPRGESVSLDLPFMTIDESRYKTPGQLIEDLLNQRGWTQRVLSIVLDIDLSTINKVVTGKRQVDAGLALGLSELFEIPAEHFLNLQKSYELAQARLIARPDPGISNRAHLFGHLPVSDMIKRGWIHAELRNVPEVESSLTKFFSAEDPSQIEILPHAPKKTNVCGPVSPAQLAWLYRVKQMAEELLVPRYSVDSAKGIVPQLRELLVSPAAARKVPRILAEAGIRFLLVESLPSAKIDGVCFWVDDARSPVVAMSVRYDRIDNFWFVLRHELEHVFRGHGKGSAMLDTELEGDKAGTGNGVAEEERVANEAAAEFCVPQKALDSFVARKAPVFAERDIIGFARNHAIHPGLVAGQLQRRLGRYDLFRAHLVKIRTSVAPSAMVDGWGDVAPVGM